MVINRAGGPNYQKHIRDAQYYRENSSDAQYRELSDKPVNPYRDSFKARHGIEEQYARADLAANFVYQKPQQQSKGFSNPETSEQRDRIKALRASLVADYQDKNPFVSMSARKPHHQYNSSSMLALA